MPRLTLTDAEVNQLVNRLALSDPLIAKITRQVQNQQGNLNGNLNPQRSDATAGSEDGAAPAANGGNG